jgi:CBS domain containing-hemolysin-like protein
MYINTATSRRLDIRTVHKDGTANFTPNSTDIDDRDFMISTVHVEGTAVYTRFLMITGAHASRLLGRHSDQIAKTVVDDLHDMFPTKVYSRKKVVSFAFSDAE